MRGSSRLLPSRLLLPARRPSRARAADLVVWWEKGFNPEEDGRSGRSSPPSSGRPASRSSSILPSHDDMLAKIVARSRPGSRPISCSATRPIGTPRQWADEDRLVDLSDVIGPFASLFDPDALGYATLFDATTGRRALYALPMAVLDQQCPCLAEPARAGRVHPRRHSQAVGGVLVVLVRPGPAGGPQGPRPRRHLGRRPGHVGRGARRRPAEFRQFGRPTRPTT